MDPDPGRRDFLRSATAAIGVACVAAGAAPAAGQTPPEEPGLGAYQSLGPADAAFVEQLVTVLCPEDEFTPGGVRCGLARFIDRQMAGAFGRGERLYLRGPWRPGRPEYGYQMPLTPEQYFRAGIAAADELCVRRHERQFAALEVARADEFLREIANGPDQPGFALGPWFNELVYPLFLQACFADPNHGGNVDKVFWRMIGYPGLPAVHSVNMVKYRGRPFPPAARPLAMDDFG